MDLEIYFFTLSRGLLPCRGQMLICAVVGKAMEREARERPRGEWPHPGQVVATQERGKQRNRKVCARDDKCFLSENCTWY